MREGRCLILEEAEVIRIKKDFVGMIAKGQRQADKWNKADVVIVEHPDRTCEIVKNRYGPKGKLKFKK